MGEWIPIEKWQDCGAIARPGFIFEIQNGAGQSLFTPCVQPLPRAPFDWKSSAVQFRLVPEPPPIRSAPLPPPRTD